MSIEKALAELTEALRENSELLRTMTAKAKASVASTGDSGKSSRSSEDGEDEGKGSGRKGRTAKPKLITAKEIGAKTSEFLEVENEDEYERRKTIIKKIVGKYEVQKMSEIADEDRAEANELLDRAIAGEDPFKRSRRDDDMA